MKLIAIQQSVMAALGYYDGAIDGVWGPKCIAALNLWQLDDSFDPALPTNGFFFTPPCRLPKGMSWGHGRSPDLHYFGFSDTLRASVDEHLGKYAPLTIQKVNDEVLGPEPKEPVKEPQPEPVKEPQPEPVKEPQPEPVKEPQPEPVKEPQSGNQRQHHGRR